jgi:hypothetical protein
MAPRCGDPGKSGRRSANADIGRREADGGPDDACASLGRADNTNLELRCAAIADDCERFPAAFKSRTAGTAAGQFAAANAASRDPAFADDWKHSVVDVFLGSSARNAQPSETDCQRHLNADSNGSSEAAEETSANKASVADPVGRSTSGITRTDAAKALRFHREKWKVLFSRRNGVQLCAESTLSVGKDRASFHLPTNNSSV